MIVQSGIRKSLVSSWGQTGLLYARATVFDNSTGTPVFLQNIAMTEMSIPGSYEASFIPVAGVAYLAIKAVYTDNTFTVIDGNFGISSEDFQCINFSSSGSGNAPGPAIFGIIPQPAPIVGVVPEAD